MKKSNSPRKAKAQAGVKKASGKMRSEVKEDIRQDTLNVAEEACYAMLKEAMEVAFRSEGCVAALSVASRALGAMDEIAVACEKDNTPPRLTRATALSYVATDWLPQIMRAMQEVIDGETAPA